MSKSLPGKPADEIRGLLAGKSQAELVELVGGRFERSPARPRWCSGAIEKNIEVHIARRSKRQGPQRDSQRRRTSRSTALAPKPSQRLDPLVAQNRFSQNQSKPRLASMRPTHQLTIDQHYPGFISSFFRDSESTDY
jgi:hypothetical protein